MPNDDMPNDDMPNDDMPNDDMPNDDIMAPTVRVRYAPSPTGDPHVGNIRTALFNWLFARHTGGSFILRIEDTDQTRAVKGALETILESLEWLGLDWDEGPRTGGPYGPYLQSQRLDLYHGEADRLVQNDNAYHCYCTPYELAEMRKQQQLRQEPPRYDHRCRLLTPEQRSARECLPYVVRFKTPLEGDPVTVHDIIRGDVTFELSALDDFVMLKSDGYPTYHLANVVDDHAMRISHVLRAEEWLPSTPRHVLLYDALEFQPPIFGHLPMLLGRDRSKLSKRHGATSLLEYRDDGFLPQAMLNFLALLGWSLDDRTELMSRSDLVEHFSLERVGKSPAIFDMDKLTWMNGVYMRRLTEDEFAALMSKAVAPYMESQGKTLDTGYLRSLIPLVQDRLKTLKPDEVWGLCSFFLADDLEYETDSLVPKGMDRAAARVTLEAASEALKHLEKFDAQAIEDVLRPLADNMQLKTRELFGAVRVAVTGSSAAPPLFDTLAAIGKERVLRRLKQAVERLSDGS